MQEILQQSTISFARSEEHSSVHGGHRYLLRRDRSHLLPVSCTWQSLLTKFLYSMPERERRVKADFDQLDKERDAMDFEGLDDFLKGAEGWLEYFDFAQVN